MCCGAALLSIKKQIIGKLKMIGTSNPWFLIQTEFWRVEQTKDYKVWQNIR